jgi:hypothetical protein
MGVARVPSQHAVHRPPHRAASKSKGQIVKNLLLNTAWPMAVTKAAWGGASGAAHRPSRKRRPAWPELLSLQPQRPVGADAEDDEDFDSSWFASSRALAQGLQVTEHSASLEVLLRRGG